MHLRFHIAYQGKNYFLRYAISLDCSLGRLNIIPCACFIQYIYTLLYADNLHFILLWLPVVWCHTRDGLLTQTQLHPTLPLVGGRFLNTTVKCYHAYIISKLKEVDLGSQAIRTKRSFRLHLS